MTTTAENTVKLPRWLEEVLPAPRTPGTLTTELQDGLRTLVLTSSNGEVERFLSIEDFADAEKLDSDNLEIDSEVFEHFSETDRYLCYPVEGGGVRMIIGRTDADRRRSIERSYAESLRDQLNYAENPSDFYLSWTFIDSHPAFWTGWNVALHPWSWDTRGYCSKLQQHVYRTKDGETRIELMAGGHVETDDPVLGTGGFSSHYGDWRLELSAETFEKAIVELAFRVSKAFDSEGNSLDEELFPYDPPEWILELQETLAQSADSV